MCRVIVDYVTGRGVEKNSETQAYIPGGYQRDTMLLPVFADGKHQL